MFGGYSPVSDPTTLHTLYTLVLSTLVSIILLSILSLTHYDGVYVYYKRNLCFWLWVPIYAEKTRTSKSANESGIFEDGTRLRVEDARVLSVNTQK